MAPKQRIKQQTKRKTRVIPALTTNAGAGFLHMAARDPNQVYEDLARLRKAIVLADYLDAIPSRYFPAYPKDPKWEHIAKVIGVRSPSEETKKVVLELMRDRLAVREKLKRRKK